MIGTATAIAPDVAVEAEKLTDTTWSFISDPNTWRDMAAWGIRIGGVLALFLVALMISRWVRNAVEAGLTRSKFDPTLTKFFANMSRYMVLLLAVLACLGVFGIETTSFAAVIGAAGLAVGLAFQGTLSNFSAGVMLLVFRPFKVGDFVGIGGEMGTVREIDLFNTAIDTTDNRRLVIPNGNIFGNTIVNVTFNSTRRVDIDVGADYGADIDATRKALEGVAANVEGALTEPAPQIFLKSLGGSSVDWQVRIWCKTQDYWDVYQRTTRATKMALDAAGIGIPFPQMDVHLDGKLDK